MSCFEDPIKDTSEPEDESPSENVLLEIDTLSNIYACASSMENGTLTIVAVNDEYTQALIIQEREGYPSGGWNWNQGENANLTLEFHIGTNVGRNYCTDILDDEEISHRYLPIDENNIPDEFRVPMTTEERSPIYYQIVILECETCVPEISLTVDRLWLLSEESNYVRIDEINGNEEIMFNYGG
jgi:hypothetical protein